MIRAALGCLLAIILVSTVAAAPEKQRGLVLTNPPKPVPDLSIRDGNGQSVSLNAFTGHPILINLWADWSAHHATELPTLDRMVPKLQELGIVVMPLSHDRGGKAAVSQTYAKLEIENLQIFLDHQRESGYAWEVAYLPVTLFVNAQGQEVARFHGAAQWDNPAFWPLLDAFAKGRPLPSGSALPRLD